MPTFDLSSPNALQASVAKLLQPGQKTSEFVAMIAVWAGSLATLLGAFNTSSPRFNAILKIGALVAAAASHIGYSISRGQVKTALGNVASAILDTGAVVVARPSDTVATPVSSPAIGKTPVPPPADAGYVSGTLIWVLAVVGIVLIVLLLVGKL